MLRLSEQIDICTESCYRKLFLEALLVIEDPLRCRRRDQSLQVTDNRRRYRISPIVISRQGNAAYVISYSVAISYPVQVSDCQ